MSLFKILFLPIILLEMLGSYGIGAYARHQQMQWMVLSFVSFGLTGALLCYLASRGGTLSWLSLLVFGCITPAAGYIVGLWFFGEKFHPQNLIALALIAAAVALLSIPRS